MQDSDERYPSTRSDYIDEDDALAEEQYAAELPLLPQNGISFALGTGLIGAVINIAISFGTTLMNTSAYQNAAQLKDNMSSSTAYLLFGLFCLNYVVALIISFAVGFVVGKVAVRRKMGFYAGALMGAVTYLGGVLLQYIPNYPGRINSVSNTSALSGILFIALLTVIWAFVAALISLWSASIATKRHPYYQAKLALEE